MDEYIKQLLEFSLINSPAGDDVQDTDKHKTHPHARAQLSPASYTALHFMEWARGRYDSVVSYYCTPKQARGAVAASTL